MNKLITLLVIGLFGVLAPLSGQITFQIDPATTNLSNGESVCLEVQVADFESMVSFQFSINYDPSVLEFDMAQGFNLSNFNASGVANPTPGNLTVSWLTDNFFEGTTVADGTAIFEICFTAITANGSSNISFSGSPTPIEISTIDGLEPLNGVAGEVVVGSGGGGGGGTLSFTASDANVMAGQQTCIEITTDNFEGIVSMQFSINYNASIVEFDVAQNFGLTGLNASNIGNPSAGSLTLSWLSDDVVNGTTVPDGTVLFEICFTGLSSGTSPVNFSGAPTPLEITDSNGDPITPDFDNGSIQVTGGGGGGTGELTFTASNESVNAGEQVCVEITTDNFDNIVSMQYSINYNASLVEFDMAQNFGLSGLNASNIGNPAAGSLTLSWLSDDVVTGTTVPDGTVLAELCFTGITNGTSPVNFSGAPTPLEITDNNGDEITPDFNNGSIQVSGIGPIDGILFSAPDLFQETGQTVCVPVSVTNFDDIVSMQFSINYNPAILQYNQGQNFNLEGFNASNLGNPSAGNITVSWLADDVVNGVSVPDDTEIFELCFTVIGSNGQVSPFNFTGTPTPIEVTDPNGEVNFNQDGGTVTVGAPPVTDLTFSASNESGENGEEVCVDISVDEFVDVTDFQFSINYDANILDFQNATNFNLTGLNGADVSNPSAGQIVVDWTNANAVSVANGTNILSLCFTIIGDPNETSPISFSNNPTPIQVSGPNGAIPFETDNGSVSVEGGIVFTEFGLLVEDVQTESGQTVCVPVVAYNFENIVSMQFSVNYNPNELDYLNAMSFVLPGFNASNVGDPSPGNITVSWLSDNVVTGTTVPDGTVLFELCFQALAPNCTDAEVLLSGMPTPVEISDPNGVIDFEFVGGTVEICPIPVPDDLLLSLGSGIGEPGEQVCIPLSVISGFDALTDLDFSLNYDPTVLSFDEVTNLNLSGLSANNILNPSNGILTFSWNSPNNNTGTTVANGGELLEFCFTLIGDDGDQSGVNFSGTPTAITVTNADDAAVPLISSDGSIEINLQCVAPTIDGFEVEDACPGLAEGSISINVADGDGNYSYQWSNNMASPSISNLLPGNYSVTVTSCGQQVTQSFTVGEHTPPVINAVNPTNVSCFGDATGAISINASGTNPSTFAWSGTGFIPNPNQANISGIGAGTYTLTITDGNGCETVSSPVQITQPASALSVVVGSSTNIDCAGNQNGAIDLTVTGGTPGYQYDWTPNLPNTQDPSGLPAGNYTVEVIDDNGCTQTLGSPVQIQEPNELQIIVDQVNDETGIANGSIFITVQGGSGNLQYLWQGPNGTMMTQDVLNLVAGDYCVTVTDGNGCEAEECMEVVKPLEIQLDEIVNTCFQAGTGAVFVTVSGGEEPYEYLWQGPSGLTFNTQDITDLDGGIYILTVTDATGEEVSLQVNVFEPNQPISINDVTVECVSMQGACDGFITINNVSGGTPPYSYNWSNNQLGQTITGLCVGTYFVTVSDANGCTTSGSGTVCFNPPTMFLTNIPPQHVDCNGASTGSWTVEVDGGLPPYTFNFSDIGPISNNDGDETRFNLAAGNYQCTVTDASGQQQVASTTINEPAAIQIVNTLIYPTTTAGNNGHIDISIDGGTLPYTYQWSNGFAGPDPVNLVENCYSLTLVDGNDCLFQSPPICVPTLEVSNSGAQDVFCENDTDGSLFVQMDGGINPPLTYTWTGPNGQMYPDTNALSDLGPGTYTVVVTDALGVSTPPFNLQVDFTSQVNVTASILEGINCPGGTDGELRADASDGQGPYDYQWSDGLGVGQVITGVGPGVYEVVVTDAFGCTDTTTVGLEAPAPFGVIEDNTQVSCFGEGDGEILLAISGGTPGYSIQWDDPEAQTTNPAIQLDGGSYNATITDSRGCDFTYSTAVEEPNVLKLIFNVSPDNGFNDGVALAVVSGGTPPYNYEWNVDAPDNTSSMITNLGAGEYTVFVTDLNGCMVMGTVEVIDGTIECLEYRNVVTPDGDGMNETFVIQCLDQYPQHLLEIYSRWGQLVYRTESYSNEWAGENQKGEAVDSGAYYFTFEYIDQNGTRRQMKGHLTVIR